MFTTRTKLAQCIAGTLRLLTALLGTRSSSRHMYESACVLIIIV